MTETQLNAYSENLINRVIATLQTKKEDVKLTPEQAVERTQSSKATLWRWEKKGYLTPIRVGGKVFYRESDIKKLMEG